MLSEQLRANFDTDIKFYRRNRILMGASLIYIALTGLSLIPSFVYLSSSREFLILKALHDSLSTAVTIVVALMGLLFMSSHFRNRNVKMVLTKPCTPETWVAGVLLSTGAILFFLQILVVAITGILFLVFGLPFQSGLVFVTIDNFLSDWIIMSFVIFLATAMPPVIATIVAIIANEGAIYALRGIVSAGHEATGSVALSVLDKVLYGIYMILPSYSLLKVRSATVLETWHVQPEEWVNLVFSLGYALAVVTLFYLLTLVLLRRKSLG